MFPFEVPEICVSPETGFGTELGFSSPVSLLSPYFVPLTGWSLLQPAPFLPD